MKQLIVIYLALTAILQAPLSSTIIEAYDLQEISIHFQTLDPQDLLLWDVDSTLIIPTDNVFRPDNDDVLEDLLAHYFSDKSQLEMTRFVSQIYHQMPFTLVDEGVSALIASLQKKSIPMLGLTAMRTGTYGIIESMEAWRVNQLRELGIDFSLVFPEQSNLIWEENNTYKGTPVFKEGIICCDHIPKGIVLTTFLQKINWRPKHVLFIDDDLNFIKSVEQAMKDLNISFIGVHYRAVEKMIAGEDVELWHHQFQVLLRDETWLSDEEAKASLLNAK